MKKILFTLTAVCLAFAGAAEAGSLTGKIVDRNKELLKSFMETGAKWNGKFDFITAPMVHITAYSGETPVGEAHPEEDGSFTIAASGEADKIILSVPDAGYYLVKEGSWPDGSHVELDVGAIPSFAITGTATRNGSPVPFEGVSAVGADGKVLTRVSTRSDGGFEIHSSVPVASLKTYFASVDGPWSSDARVDIKGE